MSINNKIRARRQELGMTVDELAEAIGKNRATVYRYENGDISNLKSDVLVPIAQALHTTPADLLFWEGYEPQTKESSSTKELLDLFNRLTPENRQRLLDLALVFLQSQ